MIIALILALTALLSLFVVRLTRGRRRNLQALENPADHLRAVDIDAFRNLVDPSEEQFLRANLAPMEFRKIQRERLRAAVDYVSCAAQNAGVLMRLADAGRRSSDPATAEAAEKLVNNALRLRLFALHAIPRLYLGMIFPGARISAGSLAESYEQMTRLIVLLGCLQYPTRGVSAAL
jgi:uncharacterized protein YyaL (SSP411 family)